MNMDDREFLVRTSIRAETLEMWVSAGWLLPERRDDRHSFTEVDVARAHLIADLQNDMGVNEAGVDVILDLLDQLYGLRCTLREVLIKAPGRASGGRGNPGEGDG
ncbi:MAG: chaperone modulator CbpM [Aestuariivirgaceae bacterium]|jgi:chaperone modulatory protein CbpM